MILALRYLIYYFTISICNPDTFNISKQCGKLPQHLSFNQNILTHISLIKKVAGSGIRTQVLPILDTNPASHQRMADYHLSRDSGRSWSKKKKFDVKKRSELLICSAAFFCRRLPEQPKQPKPAKAADFSRPCGSPRRLNVNDNNIFFN